MALSDDINEAVGIFHEGSQFLYDVATGDETSTVINPADQSEQDTVAKAVAAIGNAADYVSLSVQQNNDYVKQYQALSNMGAAKPFACPNIAARIKDASSGTYQGTVANWVTLMGVGDSLGYRTFNQLVGILGRRLGVAGVGFESLKYKTISGTVVAPSSNTQRRTDIWGTGMVRQMQSGAVVEIGLPKGGTDVKSLWGRNISIYLAAESGGGTVDIDYSYDDGNSWQLLEGGVSTDSPTLTPVIVTHDIGFRKFIRVRLTVTSGNVELIGAKIASFDSKGLVYGQTSTGGNSLTEFVKSDQGILDAVMADFAPNMILNHWYEDTDDLVPNFDTFIDMLTTAASEADVVWMAEHEQYALDDPNYQTNSKEIFNNPVVRLKASNTPRLQVWEAAFYFKSWDNLDKLGWNNVDQIHLTTDAWMFQAGLLAGAIGSLADAGALTFASTGQTGNSRTYTAKADVEGGSFVMQLEGDETQSISLRFTHPDESIGYSRYWDFTALAKTHSTNPEGFTLTAYSSIQALRPMQWSRNGRIYMRQTYTEVDVNSYGARLHMVETANGYNVINLDHTLSSAQKLVSFRSNGVENGHVNNKGEATFQKVTIGSVIMASGAGSPEGALTAPVGSTFHRTDGGAGTAFYVKESGTGNTGWVGK